MNIMAGLDISNNDLESDKSDEGIICVYRFFFFVGNIVRRGRFIRGYISEGTVITPSISQVIRLMIKNGISPKSCRHWLNVCLDVSLLRRRRLRIVGWRDSRYRDAVHQHFPRRRRISETRNRRVETDTDRPGREIQAERRSTQSSRKEEFVLESR